MLIFFLHYLCFYLVNHIIIFISDIEWDDEKAADLPFKLTINHLKRKRFAEFNENIDQNRKEVKRAKKGIRMFSLLPQNNGFNIKYCNITMSMVKEILVQKIFNLKDHFALRYDIHTKLEDIDLKPIFNFDCVSGYLSENVGYRFSSFNTDGVSCSILLKYGSPLSKYASQEER